MDFSVNNYIDQLSRTVEALDIAEVEQAIFLIKNVIAKGSKIATCGNGGSATTASHYITDWNKMAFQHCGQRINGICLNDNVGLLTAYANDMSYDDVFAEQVKSSLNPSDLLITVSGSGNSRNVVRATEVANQLGVTTLAICGFDGGQLRKISNASVWIDSMDMQICEDLHLVFGHMVMKSICSLGLASQ